MREAEDTARVTLLTRVREETKKIQDAAESILDISAKRILIAIAAAYVMGVASYPVTAAQFSWEKPVARFAIVAKRPAKTWGPVDGRGRAMLGWRMEEEAKLEFTITVNWRREDGSVATTQLATLARGACRSAEDVGVCNSRTQSQFSGGYKRLWSANNCSGTSNLYGRVLAVIIVAT